MPKRACSVNPNVAVAYLRASKDEQRLSPEAQRATIEAWAAREGIQVAAWCVDAGVCSVTPIDERPGLLEALAALREHRAGVLVVAKRDRLARDVVISAMLERLAARDGASIVSADGLGNGDGPEALLMRSIVDAFAQYERALIRARTKAALAVKRQRGERTGGIPFGYRLAVDGVRLEPDPEEQATLCMVRDLAAEGLSQRAIAATLAARGRVARSGRPFAQPQVCAMLAAK